MNNTNIKDIAELHKHGRVKVITLIDGTTVTDGLRGNAIVFDQDNLMAHAFGVNNLGNSGGQIKNPFTITSFKYDSILSINTISTRKGIDFAIDKLLADNVISEEKAIELRETMNIDKLLAQLDPLK